MNEILTSRFITFDDPQINKVILELPQNWWSRPYEYAWASSFVDKDYVVLDAACGICHPFKFYLCNLCQNVYACDLDERLLSKKEIVKDMVIVFGQEALNFPLEYLDKPHLSMQDITETSYNEAMFDRIICISVLEHLTQEKVLKTLWEFKRLLKDEGLIVLTLDYPYLELETFNLMLKESGLTYVDKVVFELPGNTLTTHLFPEFPGGLYSFRALLQKEANRGE
ncbi:MAG TPA: methyltransferase domain-containing protein [Desulfosporosinus sp.]|nr:methyltransferase domain-containing protein [Desulfosporosinus sp.]